MRRAGLILVGVLLLTGDAARAQVRPKAAVIPLVERGGVEAVTRFLLGFTFAQLAAMVIFALSRSSWPAIVGLLGVFFARDVTNPLYTTWLNARITDSSVRATVLSLSGQADAIGQAGGGPVLGLVGNVWGIRTALAAGASALAPAAALYARASSKHGGIATPAAPDVA